MKYMNISTVKRTKTCLLLVQKWMKTGADVINNFSIALLCFDKIMHSDWLYDNFKTNERAKFKPSITFLLKKC